MRNKKLFSGILIAFAIIFFINAIYPVAVAAAEKKGSVSLSVTDFDSKQPIEGVTFRLYYFADVEINKNSAIYNYVEPYDKCGVELGNLQDPYMPIHIADFALRNSLPFVEKTSDENGHICFDDLVPGAYMVVHMGNIQDDIMISPFVVSVPFYDKDSKSWNYNVNATPKIQFKTSSEMETKTYISVKKVWDTEGGHPDSVVVTLLRDFNEVESVVLNKSNNWYYRWDKLSKEYFWCVVETAVPDGYKVSYESTSNTVTIINKKDKTEDGPSTPATTNPPDKLVQTGQLNWPVPIFSIAGILFFALGWAILNLSKKEKV